MNIIVPETVELIANLATGEKMEKPLTFADFICNGLLLDQKWASNLARLHMAWDLRGSFKGATPGSRVEVTPEQQKAMREALEEPSSPHGMALAIQVRTYFEAILYPEKDGATLKQE